MAVENIQSGNDQETYAPLDRWAGVIGSIIKLAARLFQKTMDAAGYGREEVSALFKVLQKSS